MSRIIIGNKRPFTSPYTGHIPMCSSWDNVEMGNFKAAVKRFTIILPLRKF